MENIKVISRNCFFSLLLLIVCTVAFAQDNNNPPPPTEKVKVERLPLSKLEINLSTCVLIFGFLIICLEVYLVKLRMLNPDDIIKFITVTLIITGTLFLITAGYSNNQIAPAIGLFGTIAGYLVGKYARENTPAINPTPNPAPPDNP